jgi:hypothetical protein
MTTSSEQAIVLRLELSIPVPGVRGMLVTQAGGGPEQVHFLGGVQTLEERVNRITTPRPPPFRTKVRVDQATGEKYICARGQVSDDPATIQAIYARVYPQQLNPSQIPPSPPSGAAQTTVNALGDWEFVGANELPNAACGPYAYPAINTLVVWKRFTNYPYRPDEPGFTYFLGVCSTETECPQDGVPPPGTQEVLVVAPREWRVKVKGLSGVLASAFRKAPAVVLKLRQGRGTTVCWDNGGDGGRAPLVELRCDALGGPLWRLTFRAGDCTAEYSKKACDWDPLGANTFSCVTVTGFGPDDTISPTQTVEPV